MAAGLSLKTVWYLAQLSSKYIYKLFIWRNEPALKMSSKIWEKKEDFRNLRMKYDPCLIVTYLLLSYFQSITTYCQYWKKRLEWFNFFFMRLSLTIRRDDTKFRVGLKTIKPLLPTVCNSIVFRQKIGRSSHFRHHSVHVKFIKLRLCTKERIPNRMPSTACWIRITSNFIALWILAEMG